MGLGPCPGLHNGCFISWHSKQDPQTFNSSCFSCPMYSFLGPCRAQSKVPSVCFPMCSIHSLLISSRSLFPSQACGTVKTELEAQADVPERHGFSPERVTHHQAGPEDPPVGGPGLSDPFLQRLCYVGEALLSGFLQQLYLLFHKSPQATHMQVFVLGTRATRNMRPPPPGRHFLRTLLPLSLPPTTIFSLS